MLDTAMNDTKMNEAERELHTIALRFHTFDGRLYSKVRYCQSLTKTLDWNTQ